MGWVRSGGSMVATGDREARVRSGRQGAIPLWWATVSPVLPLGIADRPDLGKPRQAVGAWNARVDGQPARGVGCASLYQMVGIRKALCWLFAALCGGLPGQCFVRLRLRCCGLPCVSGQTCRRRLSERGMPRSPCLPGVTRLCKTCRTVGLSHGAIPQGGVTACFGGSGE